MEEIYTIIDSFHNSHGAGIASNIALNCIDYRSINHPRGLRSVSHYYRSHDAYQHPTDKHPKNPWKNVNSLTNYNTQGRDNTRNRGRTTQYRTRTLTRGKPQQRNDHQNV